jgi:DNA-binding protein HU-beta
MNRRDLAEAIAADTGLDVRAADAALGAALSAITGALAAGDKVTLPGFGTFETRARSERSGRNPQTGEAMTIAASTAPAFKPASALKQAVNGG